MVMTLILGALAGVLARQGQRQIIEALARFLDEEQMPDAAGRQVAALLVALLVAALLLFLLGVNAPPFLLVLAGGLGFFQQEIREAILSRRG